jgi:hypothetical protein
MVYAYGRDDSFWHLAFLVKAGLWWFALAMLYAMGAGLKDKKGGIAPAIERICAGRESAMRPKKWPPIRVRTIREISSSAGSSGPSTKSRNTCSFQARPGPVNHKPSMRFAYCPGARPQ